MQVKKQQVELGMEQWTDSNWERSRLSPCLFNFYADYIMQNARLGAKMPSLLEGISTTSDMQNSVQFSSVTQ